MQIVSAAILIVSCLSAVFFLIYVVGLFRLPVGHRPKTPTYDRDGRLIGETENPGFQETEGERHR